MTVKAVYSLLIIGGIVLVALQGCRQATEIERLDRLFRDYSGKNTPGAAILLTEKNCPRWLETYGLADLQRAVPVEPKTNFRLASVSKQFTALAVLLLAEQERLRLDDRLSDWFPDFPVYGAEITIDHLLHHTSGLLDYEELDSSDIDGQLLDRDVLNLMMRQDSTYFPPGTRYRYSNSGYAVLAMLVEKASGMRFADFLQQHIFLPLDMQNTIAFEAGRSTVANRAFGTAWGEGRFVDADQSRTSAVLGDGGIYSSVYDLFRWVREIDAKEVISPALFETAFTPNILPDGTNTGYGCGWRIDEHRGLRRIHHTGQTCGFTSVIQHFPEIRVSLVILTNRHEPMLNDLADRVMALYFQYADESTACRVVD
ncbi:beta-lactamase family protein [candidate division KSB1 bacterium]|nr:beta-lactamase family protein [candidate division KSB1 bacterium]